MTRTEPGAPGGAGRCRYPFIASPDLESRAMNPRPPPSVLFAAVWDLAPCFRRAWSFVLVAALLVLAPMLYMLQGTAGCL